MGMSYSLRAGPVVRRGGAGRPRGVHLTGMATWARAKNRREIDFDGGGMSEAGDVEGGSWGPSVAPGERGALVDY